jgi:hypothetical protein
LRVTKPPCLKLCLSSLTVNQKKTTKFYPAELAGTFMSESKGLKTIKAVQGTIARIDATIKQRTMGLEAFKITSKVFYFL